MNENKRFSLSQGGYYAIILVCAAAIGIAGIVFQRANRKAEAPKAAQTAVVMPTEPAVEAMAPQKAVLPTSVPEEVTVEVTVEPWKLRTVCPVDGNAVMDYAVETLSYNPTTRDWRTHDGIDLAAPEGTEVKAAADGTVQSVFEDDTMGTTVVIRHGGDYVSRYSSLTAPCVAPGDYVLMGQTIGEVGESAVLENSIGAHVHFAVICQDAPMDPNAFLNME